MSLYRKKPVSAAADKPYQRQGAFVGAYVTRALKQSLQEEAARQQRTASKQIEFILRERYGGPLAPEIHSGKGLPVPHLSEADALLIRQ